MWLKEFTVRGGIQIKFTWQSTEMSAIAEYYLKFYGYTENEGIGSAGKLRLVHKGSNHRDISFKKSLGKEPNIH